MPAVTDAALFDVDGDRFLPSELTRGGWSDDAQHGSPPSGLLARAIEMVPTASPMQVVRFTIDLFRPVPLHPLTVATRVLRDGLRIQAVDAVLRHGDTEVGRASGLKIRIADSPLPDRVEEPWLPPPEPEEGSPVRWRGFGEGTGLTRFHIDAVDIRSIDDSFMRLGPGTSWFRLRRPVVAGEEPTPFVRLATLADLANGNSTALDPADWVFVNPDITLYMHRHPMGEWVGMVSAAHQHGSGIGFADTTVFDTGGRIGRIGQAQVIQPRLDPAPAIRPQA